MPARFASNDSGGPRPFAWLFWLGVGLAPIAVLMLLVAQGSPALRFGVVLALLSGVLVGLSSKLCTSAGSADAAESVAGRLNQIRGELHAEVGAGAQATHRMVGDRLRTLHDEVEALRGLVDALRAGTAGPVRSSESGYGTAAVGHSAAGEDAEFSYADAHQQPAAGIGVAAVPQPAPGRARASSGRATVPPAGAVPRPHVPTGVVRHTETVKVTTRQTIVEPDGDRSDAGYGSGYYGAAAGWSVPAQRRRSAEPDRPPAGQREDVGEEPGGSGGDSRAVWTGGRARDRWATVRDDNGGREVRVGQRRARVRADETGTELRLEDRWAAVREIRSDHQDAHRAGWRAAGSWQDEHVSYDGSEPAGPDEQSRRHGTDGGDRRDRWAEDGGRGDWPERGAEPAKREWTAGSRDDEGWSDTGEGWSGSNEGWSGSNEGWSYGDRGWGGADEDPDGPAALDGAWGQRVPAALPAGSAGASSWQPTWSEPEREPVGRGHRYRDDNEAYGFPPSDGVPRAGGRQLGFERYDSRWGH